MPVKQETFTYLHFGDILKMEDYSFYNPVAKRPRRVFSKIKKPSPSTRPRTSKTRAERAKATTVSSTGGSYAGSFQLFEAMIQTLKSDTEVRETLDNITERLVQMEAAVKNIERRLQRLESPPPPTPGSPSARRQLTFGDTPGDRTPAGDLTFPGDRILPGDRTLPAPEPVAAGLQTPRAVEVTSEVTVRDLSVEREEEFFRLCHHAGKPRPDTYAASVFMALTPFDVYKRWGKTFNWSGSNGKKPLPENIKERVHQQVTQRFPDMSGEQWQKVRNRINERLRSPRKADPESQRPGYCR